MNKKVILMVLDGWGITQDPNVSAVEQAETPYIDELYNRFAHASLRTDGENVGLPEGQMGNSEVGHMNLGAGRIVYQNLAKINHALKEDTLKDEKALQATFDYAQEKGKDLHLLGLVSDGGIHAHINHLKGILRAAKDRGIENIYLHAFTDGRDCGPKTGKGFIQDIEAYMNETTGKLATVSGRYYAMDRDKRWERVAKAYHAIVDGKASHYSHDAALSIQASYDEGVTDEFIDPIVMTDTDGNPISQIKEGDAVIFFNFRTDRGRQLTEVLSQKDHHEQNMHKLDLYFTTMTSYDETFKNINIVFEDNNLVNTLGEVLEANEKKQIRMAETEKYPHVTFFFSGGREEVFAGESRILRNSPKVATYDLKPEMSAYELRDAIVPELKKGEVDFVCLNFANGDMVGHTGVMEAAIKACEAVDNCVESVVETALENGYTTLLLADHGNCEIMINPDGSPHTSHTTLPVPLILIDNDLHKIKDGVLGDVAPTILKLMGIEKPDEMTRHSLI
jgi:2,3-bisphosphoglycerate-independent phosphoglycerate mutase